MSKQALKWFGELRSHRKAKNIDINFKQKTKKMETIKIQKKITEEIEVNVEFPLYFKMGDSSDTADADWVHYFCFKSEKIGQGITIRNRNGEIEEIEISKEILKGWESFLLNPKEYESNANEYLRAFQIANDFLNNVPN